MTGDIFRGHLIDAMFNLTSVMTNQTIHLCGMLTEAIHTPFLGDRALALANARYVMGTARHFGDEISFKPDGKIERRARFVLTEAVALLRRVADRGLMESIAAKVFADVSRLPEAAAASRACSRKARSTGTLSRTRCVRSRSHEARQTVRRYAR